MRSEEPEKEVSETSALVVARKKPIIAKGIAKTVCENFTSER
jgi:hypothetical protein